MLEGVDYSGGRPGGAALHAAGKAFAMRYIAHPIVAYNLTAPELVDLNTHEVVVGLVCERGRQAVLGGAAQGRADALLVQTALGRLGLSSRPVYFAVDFDAQPAQQGSIDAYLRGAAGILGVGLVGVYGSAGVVSRCRANGSAAWFWQTYAWSGGTVESFIHVLQYHNGQSVNGAAVDFDRAYQDDFGQTPAPHSSDPNAPGGDMTVPVSNDADVLIDLPKGKQLYDLNGNALTVVSGAVVGIISPYEVAQNGSHYRVAPITSGGVRQLAMIHNPDANIRPIPPPPPPDCTNAVAAEHERTRQAAIAAVEAI